jgi:hypothetical protein
MSLGLDYRPQGDPWDMWLYGVIAPLPVAGMAFLWIISRHAVIQGKGNTTVLHGTDAVALGVTALCFALLLHFHYFWGLSEHPTLQRYHMVGKAFSFLGLIIGLVYLIWCLFRIYIL